MPVTIGSFEPLSEDEFTTLRHHKGRTVDPVMAALLEETETGRPVRVPLADGQSARGVRVAISRSALRRGLHVETIAGEGFVAVRKTDKPPIRKTAQTSPPPGKRRGRPPKRQEQDAAEIASLQDLAAGES